MGSFTEYASLDAMGLAELVRKKEVSPGELVQEAIERIEACNPQLNAVIHRLYDQARKAAAGSLPQGAFTGVPFVLKDLLSCLKGVPLTQGSRFYRDWLPPGNSEMVKRFLASGVVVVGKTNLPEFGLLPTTEPELHGPTHNPWNLDLTTGGSSGGTAASVAARLVPFGGGGDGGGSIRIPASCCGLFGLKPTRGRTPVGPYVSENWCGLAIEHVLTRSVRDSAAMLDATCGPCPGDLHYLPSPSGTFLEEVGRDPGKLRIAYTAKPMLPASMHPDCVAALDDAVELLRGLGHELLEATPEVDGVAFARAFLIMLGAQVYAIIKDGEIEVGRKARRRDFEQTTWMARLVGGAVSAGEYARAVRLIQKTARDVQAFMKDYDLLLTPTLSKPPQPLGFLRPRGLDKLSEALITRVPVGALLKSGAALDRAGNTAFDFIPFTPVFNASGQPSMSVPLTWNQANLPIGTMFTARFGDEATLFRLAGQLEQARNWHDRKPPVCG